MRQFVIVILIFSKAALSIGQQKTYFEPKTGNPVIPGFFADPSIVVVNDTFYIYATTVSKYMEPMVWYSTDLKHWRVRHLGITGKHLFWAPSVIQGEDGKTYLFYSSGYDFKCHLMVGETPFGPWEDIGKVEEGFDLQVFQDPATGKVYGFSSDPQSRPRAVEFNNDPSSPHYLKQVIEEKSIEGPFFDYTEGSFVHYKNGKYYLMYSGGKCGDVTYNIRYAVSNNVWGPYKDAPNNPILDKNKEMHVYGPGHHSLFEVDGQTYIAYHRQDYYHFPTCSERQVCIDKLEFDEKGWINKVIPTHEGVNFGLSGGQKYGNVAFGKPVTSSGNAKGFEPEFAVDDNFATRWMTGGSRGTFAVDLEGVYEISKIQPWFVYHDYFNLFKIEYSVDNQHWETYVDRTAKAEKAWKPIENMTVEARYVKISIIRGGPNASALFELKVFGKPVN